MIASPPQKQADDGQAGDGGGQVELDDGPQPEASERRGALHGSEVAGRVGEVDEAAAAEDAGGEEDGLAGWPLVTGRDEREDCGVVRVEAVEEEGKD
ncbi:hypothetical protein XA68_14814 [Ophiocordyceps unilateralis]|uniref:Uncharacterized protein n=1 Tax=Ophiocordyceps unilateralis TaxID=268505 RepID=A0A2A9P9K2_OPHUN|nr:hypothetical protein XA68_14814 [Ophiocordyceps unilateralis]